MTNLALCASVATNFAACAHRAEAGVLHYDGDYDILAEHTDLSFESIMARAGGAEPEALWPLGRGEGVLIAAVGCLLEGWPLSPPTWRPTFGRQVSSVEQAKEFLRLTPEA